MFKKFFDRDRMVMVGLIVLGALTVAAGFISGRSTFQYALSTDARHAGARWVEKAEGRLFQQQVAPIGRVSDQYVTIAAPKLFSEFQARARETSIQKVRIARSLHAEPGLLGGIDTLFSGWITSLTSLLDADDHVSQIRNFALLDPHGMLILRSDGFNPEELDSFLASTGF
ncbi:MAG: hypothetical protein ACE5FM_02545 [Methyloligellaceae bacterium]